MKIIPDTISDEIKLHFDDEDNYECTDDNGVDTFLSGSQQRELLVWFWKQKPELLREIVCENCPEVK